MRILITIGLFLCRITPAHAQAVANATIHGDVTDASGAAVPNAAVKAVQTAMGQTSSTISGTDGAYVLPNLPVGPYRLEVSSPSFSTYVQSGITLQVGNNVQINVKLQVGAVTQEVQVSAAAAMVETQDTSVSEVIDQRRIIDLPLNGRQATDLILLSGGANVPPNAAGRFITTHDYVSSVGVSIAGGQENGNNYLLDGGDHNDTHSNVNLPFPFPDALQEFSVQTNGVSARYGLHPYAVVNAITKSGTNQIHGGLFEFVRNGALNARNFFAPAQDSLRRNQFGGTVGGPIRKDKIFLFNGFQATRTRTAPPQSISFVPTAAVLTGDFNTVESAACQSSGKRVQLVDPANNQPFPNNFISPTRFSTPSVNLAKLIPVPTDPCGRLVYAIPNPNNENQYVGAGGLDSEREQLDLRPVLRDRLRQPGVLHRQYSDDDALGPGGARNVCRDCGPVQQGRVRERIPWNLSPADQQSRRLAGHAEPGFARLKHVQCVPPLHGLHGLEQVHRRGRLECAGYVHAQYLPGFRRRGFRSRAAPPDLRNRGDPDADGGGEYLDRQRTMDIQRVAFKGRAFRLLAG